MTVRRLTPINLLVIAALLLASCSGWLWWHYVYSNPERVFNAMLNNSLRLSGVTKEIVTQESGQSSKQTVQMQFGAGDRVRTLTELTQTAEAGTVVVNTEGIGTPTVDFTRYLSIKADQKDPSGKDLDFTKLLNVWGRGATDTEGKLTAGQLYSETTLGVVPFGNLNKADRRELLKLSNEYEVYKPDYTSVVKRLDHGRPTYTYDVTIDAVAYVRMLKRLGEMRGLNHLGDIDPAQYAGGERLPFTFTVDVWSRQLKVLDYTGLGHTETYGGHNGRYDITLPTEYVPIEELQARLGELQQ
jgi:hypothetical protein